MNRATRELLKFQIENDFVFYRSLLSTEQMSLIEIVKIAIENKEFSTLYKLISKEFPEHREEIEKYAILR